MDVFDVIINSANTIKEHPKFVLPTVLVLVLALVLGLVFSVFAIMHLSLTAHQVSDISALVPYLKGMIPALALMIVIFFFINVLIQGVYISLCLRRMSKTVSLSWAFGAAAGRYRDLLLFSIVALAIFLAVSAVFLLPVAYIGYNSLLIPYLNGAHASASAIIWFAVLALVFVILYAIAMITVSVFLFAGAPLVVLKRIGPMQAFRESYAIGRKDFANILVLLISNAILIGVVEMVGSAFQIIPILGIIIYIIINLFVSAYSQLVPAMYYLTFYKK